MGKSELFWDADLAELKRGYAEEGESYRCLLCGHQTEKGIVYPFQDVLYDAERFMRIHIEVTHQSVFESLLEMDKKLTGLTDHQKGLLRLFYQGKSDKEVQEELEIGSASTIRHHRFSLKEKERQAKVFLAIMELLKEKDAYAPAFVPPHQNATMVDDRYDITGEEQEEIIRKFMPEGASGRLKKFPPKEKQRLVVLRAAAKRLETGRTYSERELNRILGDFFEDYVLVRRYLIDYGFLDRTKDGREYWLKDY